jgi:hypothetical protein
MDLVGTISNENFIYYILCWCELNADPLSTLQENICNTGQDQACFFSAGLKSSALRLRGTLSNTISSAFPFTIFIGAYGCDFATSSIYFVKRVFAVVEIQLNQAHGVFLPCPRSPHYYMKVVESVAGSTMSSCKLLLLPVLGLPRTPSALFCAIASDAYSLLKL